MGLNYKKELLKFAKKTDLDIKFIDNVNESKTINVFFEGELMTTLSGTTPEKDFNGISQAMLFNLVNSLD